MNKESVVDFSTAAVMFCGLGFTTFTQYLKRRVGLTSDFYRLALPWGGVTILLMALFAWLCDQHFFSKGFILVPGVATNLLALAEYIRWRTAVRDGTVVVPPPK